MRAAIRDANELPWETLQSCSYDHDGSRYVVLGNGLSIHSDDRLPENEWISDFILIMPIVAATTPPATIKADASTWKPEEKAFLTARD
jgi:hypothetical protein